MKKQQSGFTMIELIMVIVILGILAAFALPKFADFSGDARVSTVNGVGGSIRSAAAIAHAAQLAAGAAENADVTLEGTAIKMVGGYPTAAVDGIIAAAQVDGIDVAYGTGTVTLTPNGGGASCRVVYTQAAPADNSDPQNPIAATPYSLVISDTGCN
ncbi:prepilin-type N-terminal cleavage/methylation domain-containing protein [Stutzerimonas stutzeri]|uniref:pilin n=1 Tax=Stutzerimonas stutzeri TaxID=316 RepID=UPI00309FF87D|nr:type II secretion system protein [Stutzerimonas stutzeri]